MSVDTDWHLLICDTQSIARRSDDPIQLAIQTKAGIPWVRIHRMEPGCLSLTPLCTCHAYRINGRHPGTEG